MAPKKADPFLPEEDAIIVHERLKNGKDFRSIGKLINRRAESVCARFARIMWHQNGDEYVVVEKKYKKIGATFKKVLNRNDLNVGERKCLHCQKNFLSEWKGNRICGNCKKKLAFQGGTM